MTILKSVLRRVLARLGYDLVRRDGLRHAEVPLDAINTARLMYYDALLQRTKGVSGDIVECGVGWGRSMLSLALLVKLRNDPRNLWGFDSFEGFPDPSEADMTSARKPKKGEYSVGIHQVYGLLTTHLGDEQFVRSRITLVKGYFEHTLDVYPRQNISLLNLDVDLYESYRSCLEGFWPLLASGGVVTFDEYIRESFAFPGAQHAIKEFFHDKGVEFSRDPFYGKYFVVKP